MRRTLALVIVLATPLACRPAGADVGPPLLPTMFVVVQREGISPARLRSVRAALTATLPKLPKRFRVVLITEGPQRTPHVSTALSGRQSKQLVAPLARGYVGKPRRLGRLLVHVLSLWSGSNTTPRHHVIVIPAKVPTADHTTSLGWAVRRGFTVSFLLPSKPKDTKVVKQLELGGGNVQVTSARALVRTLQRELRWTKLSVADQKRRAGLLRAARPPGLLGVLRGGAGGVGHIFGTKGLGLKRSYVPKLFARGDMIVGARLAAGFRRIRCAQICDVAAVRQQLLAKARSLLACLERDVKLISPRDVLRIPLDDKLDTPEARCVRAWRKGLGRPALSAVVEIGDARAVH